jgi:hypothetical protein
VTGPGGRGVPPIRNGQPVAIGVARQLVLKRLREGSRAGWRRLVARE